MRIRLLVVACVLFSVNASAQTYRLRGTTKSDAGAPVENARVRAQAITGFQGGPTTGATEFEAKSNKKGEWTIVGLTPGTWVFEARADGLVPQAFVFPLMLAERQLPGQYNPSLTWDLPFVLRAASGPLQPLERIAAAATPANAQATIAGLTDASTSTDPIVLIAAGDIALLARQPRNAQLLYEQASKPQPVNPLALVGVASAGMMLRDWDAALKGFWNARDAAPKELKPALGAAIKDLQRIAALK